MIRKRRPFVVGLLLSLLCITNQLNADESDMKMKEFRPQYSIQRAVQVPSGFGCWSDPAWTEAQTLEISNFREKSSEHRPLTQARVMYDDQYLYVQFRVMDRYVRAVAEKYQDLVYQDSCVEFFVQPKPGQGYFNFEVNAGGCMLLYFIPCSPEGMGILEEHQPVPAALVQNMNIYHSMPSRIDPEIQEPTEWRIEYRIPLALFEHYLGPIGSLSGQTWRGNFYKCANHSSHPHWGMWAPIHEGLFHQPAKFGEIIFKP
jgi:hypothetical protein